MYEIKPLDRWENKSATWFTTKTIFGDMDVYKSGSTESWWIELGGGWRMLDCESADAAKSAAWEAYKNKLLPALKEVL